MGYSEYDYEIMSNAEIIEVKDTEKEEKSNKVVRKSISRTKS